MIRTARRRRQRNNADDANASDIIGAASGAARRRSKTTAQRAARARKAAATLGRSEHLSPALERLVVEKKRIQFVAPWTVPPPRSTEHYIGLYERGTRRSQRNRVSEITFSSATTKPSRSTQTVLRRLQQRLSRFTYRHSQSDLARSARVHFPFSK